MHTGDNASHTLLPSVFQEARQKVAHAYKTAERLILEHRDKLDKVTMVDIASLIILVVAGLFSIAFICPHRRSVIQNTSIDRNNVVAENRFAIFICILYALYEYL